MNTKVTPRFSMPYPSTLIVHRILFLLLISSFSIGVPINTFGKKYPDNSVQGSAIISANQTLCNSVDDVFTTCELLNYCESTSNFPWHEWISRVQLNTLDQSSGKSTYSDFTSLSTTLEKGNTYALTLQTSYSYTTYDEYWRVWIDYNQNGDFTDPGEMVFNTVLSSPPDGVPLALLDGIINIPTNVLSGNTRMRVSMQRGNPSTPCALLPFGEVEDYNVNIINSTPRAELSLPNYEVIPGGIALCYTEIGSTFGFFGGTIVNFGLATSDPYKLKVTFSRDDQISPDDVFWQEFQYNGLDPNNADYFTVDNPVPTALTPGFYYAIIQLDSDNEVLETNEFNNVIKIRVRLNAPDYTVTQVSNIPSTAAAGSIFSFDTKISNLLPFPLLEISGDLSVEVFLSENNLLEFNNDERIGSKNISYNQFSNSPLFEGGSVQSVLSVSIPPDINEGDYYLFVHIRFTCEMNSQNNTSAPYPIYIEAGTATDYCESVSDFPWHDWIGKVAFANINNHSGKSTYSDFTSINASVETGVNYPINLQTDYSYTTYDEYWSVWIDFNQNGSFYDAGERVFDEVLSRPPDGTPLATMAGSIYIPESAFPGNTRMRVSMKRGSAPDPCDVIPYGEVEDYSVSISNSFNGSSGQLRLGAVQVELFPNPVIDEIYVNLFKHANQSGTIKIYDLYGHVILDRRIDEIPNYPIQVDLSNIENGMYFLSTKVENLKTITKRFVVEKIK